MQAKEHKIQNALKTYRTNMGTYGKIWKHNMEKYNKKTKIKDI